VSPRSEEYFWRARRSLREAELLLREHLSEGAISRAYYAMVEAAQGALSERNVHPKTHDGLWTRFSNEFVKSGPLDRSWPAVVARAQGLRERGDYEAEQIEGELAEEIVRGASDFIDAVERLFR
jgi:uncharacterized protein (UPF0332 family)